MLIASFLFGRLDAGRAYIVDAYADMTSELALESLCAEYQPMLWENYHLLCLDGAYGEEDFSMERISGVLKHRIERNLEEEKKMGSLLALRLRSLEATRYQLLTDGEGQVFLKRIADYMKDTISLELAQKLYQTYLEGGQMSEESTEDRIETAQKALEEAQKSRQRTGGETGSEEGKQIEETVAAAAVENPMEIAQNLKRTMLLELVVENHEEISKKRLNDTKRLSERTLQIGTDTVGKGIRWQERLFVLEYLGQYYGSYATQKENGALTYEMEYVLCGSRVDRENLEGAIMRLLLLREVANVTHILSDSEKRGEAELLAVALAGFTANPGIIKAVEMGIIAAWAYMESIQDVRALLDGDKIALIKGKEQWTINVSNLSQSFQTTKKAKHCESGLTYESYLKLILWGMREERLAAYMMDIMEQNLRQIPDMQNCRMDHMISSLEYQMEYEAKAIFFAELFMRQIKTKQFSYE
ncbi:MAG: DUF5702 domain-containing protein, partial [Roseburia sp.]